MAIKAYGGGYTGFSAYIDKSSTGDLLIYDTGGGQGLYRLRAGSYAKLGSGVGFFSSVTVLSDGGVLLYRQLYADFGHTSFAILNADGSLRVGETNPETNGDGQGNAEYTYGPSAVALANGGFFFAVTDRTYRDQLLTLSFPRDSNYNTSASLNRAGDVSHRLYSAQGVAAGAFVFDTPSAAFNYNGTSGSGLIGDQVLNSTVGLTNGTVVEASLDPRYFTNYTGNYGAGGYSQQYVVAVTLVGAGGTPVVVQANTEPLTPDGVTDPAQNHYHVYGDGGIQLVALRQGGFAVFWQERTYTPDASVYGGFRGTGLDMVVRYFSAAGAALTDEIHFLHRNGSYDGRSLGLAADALADGRIEVAYVARAADASSGEGLYVTSLGALGAGIETALVALAPSGNIASFVDWNVKTIAGTGRFAVSWNGSTDGGHVQTFRATTASDISAPYDFSFDDRSDVLVQLDDGTVAAGFLGSGLALSGTGVVDSPGAAWHLVGSADFNGDGVADLLEQNTDGSVRTVLLDGAVPRAVGSLGNPGGTWHVRGIADFTNDGRADVLVQNSTDGALALGVVGAGGTAVSAVQQLGTFGAAWHVEGVGDFDGDGKQDALFQNDDGRIGVVLQASFAAGVQVLGNPGPGASIAGTGDYNRDGKTDVLVHKADGTVLLATLNGAAVAGLATLGSPGAAFTTAVAGGDYDGDGKLDVLVQATDGTVAAATLDGSARITASAVLGSPGAGVRVVGNVPTQFLDGAAAGTLAGTPGADAFLLSAPAAGLHAIGGFDPVLDRVVLSRAAFASYAAVQAAETSSASGTTIALGAGASLLIQGIAPQQLQASNFGFA